MHQKRETEGALLRRHSLQKWSLRCCGWARRGWRPLPLDSAWRADADHILQLGSRCIYVGHGVFAMTCAFGGTPQHVAWKYWLLTCRAQKVLATSQKCCCPCGRVSGLGSWLDTQTCMHISGLRVFLETIKDRLGPLLGRQSWQHFVYESGCLCPGINDVWPRLGQLLASTV
eukprot:5282375-Amphidinium_carterae.4